MAFPITVRDLTPDDIPVIVGAFEHIGWNKPRSQYEGYLSQHASGARTVRAAFKDSAFTGYATILWTSQYPGFADTGIPEINDMNVLPEYRRRGIGTQLIEDAERIITQAGRDVAGIGVGMTADYGAAQRLYVKLGYVPDGRGLHYRDHPIVFGNEVRVDDDLVLYFTKRLTRG